MVDDSTTADDLEDTLRRHQRGGGEQQGTLTLSDDSGYVGDTITFQGQNCSPESDYEIVWHTTQGSWGVIEANEVVGPKYKPRTETVGEVTADESGEFDLDWQIFEDYGGNHIVELQSDDGLVVDRAQFNIRPWFELDRTEAALGEAFTITGYGIGPRTITNNYQVAWDNGYVGFMTGVMNHGTATAQVRAVGPPGEHVIDIWRNHRGVPYLQNNTQSPFGSVGGERQSRWTVEVTERDARPRPAWVDPMFDESPIEAHYPDIDADAEASLEIQPQCGQSGTTVFITGTDFPPEETVELIWYRHEGQRTKEASITPQPDPDLLPTVTTDEKGTFQAEVDLPPEEGGTRPITAAVDGREVAVTGFMMQPDIERIEPKSGPVGTSIEIDLSGIGWTSYETAPYFVYDNKPLGYAIGDTAEGEDAVVRVELPATGEPGWHFIDVYPSLFTVNDDDPEFELRPHLSYIDNHPIRPLPAMHLAFEVTEE